MKKKIEKKKSTNSSRLDAIEKQLNEEKKLIENFYGTGKWTVEIRPKTDLVMHLRQALGVELEGTLLSAAGIYPMPNSSSLAGWLFCSVVPERFIFRRKRWWHRRRNK